MDNDKNRLATTAKRTFLNQTIPYSYILTSSMMTILELINQDGPEIRANPPVYPICCVELCFCFTHCKTWFLYVFV